MERRDSILDSAERLARSRGYDAFSYADLSAEVGIRKASIHHHFPTKADLALALMERYRGGFAEALNGITARADKASDRLRGFVDAYRAALNSGTTICLCAAFSAGRDSLSEPVLQSMNAFHAHTLGWLTETYTLAKKDSSITNVREPAEEAAATLALVEGAQLMARAAADVGVFDLATASLESRLA